MSQHLRALGVLVMLILGSATAFAAKDPVTRLCDVEFAKDEYNNRIDCKAENANAALFDYVDTLIELDKMRRAFGRTPLFTDSQMEHLTSARGRAQNAKNRSHMAKAFRGQAKRQKAEDEDCYVKELIGDGTGDDVQPCEKNEDCEEVIGDEVGDDVQPCKVKGNPASREVCVQVCQQPLPDEPENYDSEVAFDTEQGLEELEVVLDDATEEVKAAITRMSQHYETRPADADDCDMYEFGLFPGSVAMQASQVAKNVADAVFNSCSVACNQDAFGWNCEAACVVFAVIAGVLNGVDDAFAVLDGANGSDQLDRVAKCTRQLGIAVEGTKETIDDVEEKVDALKQQIEDLTRLMEERFLVIEDHLCRPQGQRECFPDGAQRESAPAERESRTQPRSGRN